MQKFQSVHNQRYTYSNFVLALWNSKLMKENFCVAAAANYLPPCNSDGMVKRTECLLDSIVFGYARQMKRQKVHKSLHTKLQIVSNI